MKTIRRPMVITIIWVLALVGPVSAGLIEPRNAPIPNFSSLSSKAALDHADTIVSAHGENVANLIGQLRHILAVAPGNSLGAGAARRAVCLSFVLADLRASGAAPTILKGITLNPPWPGQLALRISLPMLWGRYPMVLFMTEIGMPSVHAILKVLPHETNALRRKLMVRVLVGVEGRAVTRFRLKRAIAKTPNAAVKANLKSALGDVATSVSRR